jgi:hypothetical protein
MLGIMMVRLGVFPSHFRVDSEQPETWRRRRLQPRPVPGPAALRLQVFKMPVPPVEQPGRQAT